MSSQECSSLFCQGNGHDNSVQLSQHQYYENRILGTLIRQAASSLLVLTASALQLAALHR